MQCLIGICLSCNRLWFYAEGSIVFQMQLTVASIWFEIRGGVIFWPVTPGKKKSIFQANFQNISRQKLAIYNYFWANYFISIQKSPLSNILPVHDKIY